MHHLYLLLELLEGVLNAIRLQLLVVQTGLQVQRQLIELLQLLVQLVPLVHDQLQRVLVLLFLLHVLLVHGLRVLTRNRGHHLYLDQTFGWQRKSVIMV